MGRETKILLGLLGLLAGAFVGVLSMKLLVPRPPAGAGPDVHPDLATVEPHDVVEPPAPAFGPSAFAAAPPLRLPPAAESDHTDRSTIHPAGFAAAVPPTSADEPPRRDPFVTPASFEQPAAAEPPAPAAADDGEAASAGGPIAPPDPQPAAFAPDAAPVPLAGGYVVMPGDSWWSVAERSYGDGRLYRALFAWNRTANPRLTLAPGTPLDIPPLANLAAAWPHLVPPRP